VFYGAAREVILQVTDMLWVEHLEAMDYLRGSVNLRAYGQRDPLVEYKREGLRMFKEMEQTARLQVLSILPNIVASPESGINVSRPAASDTVLPDVKDLKEIREGADEITAETKRGDEAAKRAADPYANAGRNDPCPCGSGKKFKKCHGQ
jgi:preprotein translocase subunit SecA